MIRVLFICHSNISKIPGKVRKINDFTDRNGAYYTIFERILM